MKRRRGWCPDCAKKVALTPSGRIWAHNTGPFVCSGSGKRPGDDTR